MLLQELVKDEAGAEPVRLVGHPLAGDLLGRSEIKMGVILRTNERRSLLYNVPVSSRSFSEPFPLVCRSEVCPGVAKVADPDVSVGVQHDVGGLEVAVENTGGEMEILQGEDQLYQIES